MNRPAGPPPTHGKGRKARVVYAWDRRVFYEKLEELMARGFPKKPRTAGPARFYEGSRKALLAYLAGRDGIYPKDAALEAFLDFENRLCAIPHGLEAREIYGTIPWRIHFFMSNLIGYHHSGFRHEAKAALSMLPEIEAAFRSHGDGDTIAFLHVLEADLDRGPAMLEQ